MSGGFTPGLRTTDINVDGGPSFLASEHMQVKRVGVTLDASLVAADGNGDKVLAAGTFVTPVTATGKYGIFDAGALDGRQTGDVNVSGFLLEGVNLRDGDTVAGIMLHGSVLGARTNPTADTAGVATAIAGRITVQ